MLREKLCGLWARYQKRSRQEKLLILLTASAFFPVPITVVTLIVVCVDALVLKQQRQELFRVPGVNWLCLSFFWVLTVSLLSFNWLGAALFPVAALILVAGVYARRYMTRSLFYALVDLSCVLSFPCFLVAAIQRWTTPAVHELIARPASTFFNANYYGCVIEMLIIICIARLADGVPQRKQILYYFTIAVNALGLLFCNSFSACFGIFAGCVMLLILHKRYYACIAMMMAFGVASILIYALPMVLPRVNYLPEILQLRTDIWDLARQGVYQHPLFGQGFLSFWKLSEGMGSLQQPHAHNMPLDFLLNFGVIGSLVVLAYFIRMFATFCRRYLVTKRRGIYQIILALAAGWLVHGMTDVTLLWIQTGLLAVIFLGGYGAEEKRGIPDPTFPYQ